VRQNFLALLSGGGQKGLPVTFKDGTQVLGSAAVDRFGRATLSGVHLSHATQSLTAIYEGDQDFLGVTASDTLRLDVQ
jgi:Bacterial Ig-like domain (group 3)